MMRELMPQRTLLKEDFSESSEVHMKISYKM